MPRDMLIYFGAGLVAFIGGLKGWQWLCHPIKPCCDGACPEWRRRCLFMVIGIILMLLSAIGIVVGWH